VPIARLALATLLTAIVTSSSMLLNDFYDYRRGVDAQKPHKELVSGRVRLETVKTTLKWVYAGHLALVCLLDSVMLRLAVLANTLLTYVYTPHLKPVTGLKNVVCATVIACAVGVGAVASASSARMELAALRAVWRPLVAVAGLIWHRELLMDIADRDGDRDAGLRTVPVVFGTNAAFAASLVPLGIAGVVAATVSGSVVRKLLAAAPLAVQAGLALVWARRGEDEETTKEPRGTRGTAAIEAAPYLLLGSLIALTA